MKILVISERFPPEGTGGPLATYLLISKLAKLREFKFTILTDTKTPRIIPGVKYIFLPHLSGETKINQILNQSALLLNEHVAKLVQQHDLIYITDHSYLFVLMAKRLNKPVIIHMHDLYPISSSSTIINYYGNNDFIRLLLERFREALDFEVIQGRPFQRGILAMISYPIHATLFLCLLSMADRIITVSRMQSKILISHMPWIKSKVKTIYNIPPPIKFLGNPLSKDPSFLYAGGSNVIKGFQILVQLLIKMKKEFSQKYELMMTGISMHEDPNWCRWYRGSTKFVKKFLRWLKIAQLNKVKVMGWIDRDTLINNIMKYTWCTIFPSLCYEPLPYTVMETCLAGRIPITTLKTGFTELLYDKFIHVFFLKKASIDELIEKIEIVASLTPSELVEYGIKVRHHILRRLFADSIVKEFVNLLTDVKT